MYFFLKDDFKFKDASYLYLLFYICPLILIILLHCWSIVLIFLCEKALFITNKFIININLFQSFKKNFILKYYLV